VGPRSGRIQDRSATERRVDGRAAGAMRAAADCERRQRLWRSRAVLCAGCRRGRLARHGGTIGHRWRPARRRSGAARASRRHRRHLRHCHRRHHHHCPCRRRRSPQPRSSRLRATQRRISSTSCVSPSLANGGPAAARKQGAASTIVAEHRFAQQTKIAKLLMSQILTHKSGCELKVQGKCYASFAAPGVLALRRLPHRRRPHGTAGRAIRRTARRRRSRRAAFAAGRSVARQLTGFVDPMCVCALVRLCAWG
jgi:hypothetical protein